ncbi:uncharacterized protein LOC132786161 [Drosophila nasuta]|uniref:uncharacterized protein LOC132786161 n=1 Tax=Drosophila nasuta TaxID=42062 RepID=UPI00295E6335|nr:uncharacterized protein LOC132786161 [Drosophila nasuta]
MRALINPCTATSRISASLATAYGLSVTRVGTEGICTAIIRSLTSEFRRKVLLQMDSQLCRSTPLRPVDGENLEQFRSITLADERWFQPSMVSLVLGTDVYPHII